MTQDMFPDLAQISKKKNHLSHEEVEKIMNQTLQQRLIKAAKKIRQIGRDEISCRIEDKDVVIIAPVTRKNTHSIKDKIMENSARGIATGFIFPQASYQGQIMYSAGRYQKKFRGYNSLPNPLPGDLGERLAGTVNNLVELSVIERLLESFGENLTYFNPVERLIRNNVQFTKKGIPEGIVDWMLGIESEGKVTGDQTLRVVGRELRATYGKGHSKKILVYESRKRYVDISKLEDRKERVRLKSIDKKMEDGEIKGQFTLETSEIKTIEYGIIRIARVVPYRVQGKLFG